MKVILLILVSVISFGASAQVENEHVPSYFGLQVRPVFPTRFIGNSTLSIEQEDPELIYITTSLKQKIGYSFGGTVRVGLTKLIAFETGLNFTQRNFDLNMAVPDSSIDMTRKLSFISYDLPINALFYIPLAEKWYMNASLGVDVNFAPTEIEVKTDTTGANYFWHRAVLDSKISLGLNANVGFEFRTEKSGFFYLGGSAKVPFKPIFSLITNYHYQGYKSNIQGDVDGSFLSIDFKYFFPNIKNKGPQPMRGPIVQ
jgi:hypothetical protein